MSRPYGEQSSRRHRREGHGHVETVWHGVVIACELARGVHAAHPVTLGRHEQAGRSDHSVGDGYASERREPPGLGDMQPCGEIPAHLDQAACRGGIYHRVAREGQAAASQRIGGIAFVGHCPGTVGAGVEDGLHAVAECGDMQPSEPVRHDVIDISAANPAYLIAVISGRCEAREAVGFRSRPHGAVGRDGQRVHGVPPAHEAVREPSRGA